MADRAALRNADNRGRSWRTWLPPIHRWGPIPGLPEPRRLRPFPEARGPSPEPAPASADGSGWENVPPAWVSPAGPWKYDAHPDYSGWDASATGHAAALLLNAAYDSASAVGTLLPAVDFRWHRPDQLDVQPQGYNARGDLAPVSVHAEVDTVLRSPRLSGFRDEPVRKLLHAAIDGVWMRHSRCPARCIDGVRRLGAFSDDQARQIAGAICDDPLTDARLIMLCLDARAQPIYGRTLSSPGVSRLFRRFPDVLVPASLDHAKWDEDDGGESGSSRGASPSPESFAHTQQQAVEQQNRHMERRLRRAVRYGDCVAEEIVRTEDGVREMEERLRTLVLRHDTVNSLLAVVEAGLGVITSAPMGTPVPWPAP